MEYSLDQSMNRFLNDYDATMEHYVYDDFDIDELENCHALLDDSAFEEIEDGINFIDM